MSQGTDDARLARIRVAGIGGAGGNAINRMIAGGMRNVDFIAMNTDAQALIQVQATTRIHLGEISTRGMGSGGDPARGAQAGEESLDAIRGALEGSDLVFVALGLGGGTGTGAGPVVARVAKQTGALVVGIVTLPFSFEGRRRSQAALAGLASLRDEVDTLITIPNDRLLKPSQPELTLNTAFKMADEILRQAVGGLAELITTPGLINLDFADLRSVMASAGTALMAVGAAEGPDRARKAARAALASPLLGLEVTGARGVVCNVTGGDDLTLLEVQTVAEVISAAAHPEATLIFGAVTDDAHAGQIQVTVVATGFTDNSPLFGLPPMRSVQPMFPQATSIVRAATDKLAPDQAHGSLPAPLQGPLPASPLFSAAITDVLGPPSGPTEKTPAIERHPAHSVPPSSAPQQVDPVPVAAPNGRERDGAVVPSYLRRLWR